MFSIYAMNLPALSAGLVLGLLVWTGILWAAFRQPALRRAVRLLCALLLPLALYGILFYTVLHRVPSLNRRFVLIAWPNPEFWRELFMNALLYVPFGLSLTVFLGPWSVLAALVLSVLIEGWQYCAGTGLSQGTDVLMNTLGAAAGALPYLALWLCTRRRGSGRPADPSRKG